MTRSLVIVGYTVAFYVIGLLAVSHVGLPPHSFIQALAFGLVGLLSCGVAALLIELTDGE